MGTILNGKENIFIWGGGLLIYWEEKKFSYWNEKNFSFIEKDVSINLYLLFGEPFFFQLYCGSTLNTNVLLVSNLTTLTCFLLTLQAVTLEELEDDWQGEDFCIRVLCEDEQASIIKYYLGSFIEEVEAVFLYLANYLKQENIIFMLMLH